jgi:serine/threonine-protein kinase RIO1
MDMRRMYHECNLVHGDLSEYNLLWYQERPVIIDVSQSVEHAHPFANDFLKKDVQNINEFFSRREVSTLSNYHLFRFITTPKDQLIQMIETYVRAMIKRKKEKESREEGEEGQGEGEKKEESSQVHENLSEMISRMMSSSSTVPVTHTIPTHSSILSHEEISLINHPCPPLIDFPVSVLDYLLTKFIECQDAQNDLDASQTVTETNESEIQEAVFLKSYIPSSLNEFSNPVTEKNKLDRGQREAAYTSAMHQLLAPAVEQREEEEDDDDEEQHDQKEAEEVKQVKRQQKKEKKKEAIGDLVPRADDEKSEEEGQSDDSESGSESDSDESGSNDEDEEGEEGDGSRRKRRGGVKYRRRLPGTDSQPEERKQIKDERKEAKRAAKEAAALKRTQKVPKHVKKRAVKTGKKK